jgi:N-acetylglucosamine-6-sulfatase
MGDNGLLEGEHGMVDKRTMHEPSIRIPVIARGPGLPAGKVVSGQVLTEDVAPSILDRCGAPPLVGIHGRSWNTLVTAGDPAWRTEWLYEYNYEKQFPYTPNVRAVRTESWKYMRYPHGDGGADRHMAELYNIEFDREERYNLIADERYAGVVEEMKKELTKVMGEAGLTEATDKMPMDEGIKAELPDAKIR